MIEYRKEIDGLRAVAVLPVLFFHAGFSGFSGGYVGVDIFFVISGFLITSILAKDLADGRFSIINFYERRARRIIPALSFMLLSTTIFAYLLLSPIDLREYSQSLISVTTFVSNIFFYLESGYFAGAAEEMPLLHTWSLAVEEQYYLFFPPLLWLLWKLPKNLMLLVLIVFSGLSLALSEILTANHQIEANFYLIFSRAWELFAGSILAFIPRDWLTKQRFAATTLSSLGLVMVGFSIVMFDNHTPFPSLYALVPVVGSVLIIYFTLPDTFVWRLLTLPFMVGIGLISYSLYLWHQPIYAFIRVGTIGNPAFAIFIVAIVASALLAYLSWRYIERPFRTKGRFNRKEIFGWSLASIAGFLLVGFVGHFNNGFGQRFNTPNYSATIQHSPKREDCHTIGANYLKPADACQYFSGPLTWAVMGDSHVSEPVYELATRLKPYHQSVVQLSFSGCPPALLFTHDEPGCNSWTREAVNYITNNNDIQNVLIGYRYTSYLFGYQQKSYPELPNQGPVSMHEYASGELGLQQARELYWQSFEQIIEKLVTAGKQVYLLYPIPELPADIKKITSPKSVFNADLLLPVNQATTTEYYVSRNRLALEKLDVLAKKYHLQKVEPFKVLCNETGCPSIINGKVLYFDDNHLSLWGSKLLVDSIEIDHDASVKNNKG
ncbi:acyltransferase family protein [Neptunicella sp. SCSIO 80796]|uniref:acyltransferase family protein n=1 Tax=Neptunicella plasticusilytica TaxID=3117012 RepID=UPI003A4E2FDA